MDDRAYKVLLDTMREEKLEYAPELVVAVLYLMEKGITRTAEIAKRLDISFATAHRVKWVIMNKFLKKLDSRQQNKDSEQQVVESERAKQRKPKKEKRANVLEILGLAKE